MTCSLDSSVTGRREDDQVTIFSLCFKFSSVISCLFPALPKLLDGSTRLECAINCRKNILWLKFIPFLDGPVRILQEKIAQKSLLPDKHQVQIVSDLQSLYEKVKTYEPKSASGVGSWFSFVRKKDETSEIKGLYIYGSVGGGKTMLMDMFFDCCKVCDRESILGNSFSHATYF